MVDEGEAGRLFIVSTPIGNMGDFSFRAVETLRAVDLVLAEDTRHSRPLLERYEIAAPLESYHEHNEARTAPRIVERLLAGDRVALITDAGTPLLSDPGARLVRSAIDAGVTVVPIPGASALLAALVGAGLDATRFTFFGFLARRGRERQSAVAEIARSAYTAILYEAPGRVADTLVDLSEAGAGSRHAVVARELTKQFEEFRRGTVDELAAYYRDATPRGEVVIVIEASVDQALTDDEVRSRVAALRGEGLGAREIVSRLVDELGIPRNRAYRLAHET